MKYWGILPAAGSGKRMATNIPKQYCRIGGRYLIDHSLTALFSHPLIKTVVVSLKENDPYWRQSEYYKDSRVWVCQGGARREHSVWAAMQILRPYCDDDDWVLVHDAVRPCLHRNDLATLIRSLQSDSVGGILAQESRDATKLAGVDGYIKKSLDRRLLYRAQTPQMFRYSLIFKALQNVIDKCIHLDDEAAAMEEAQHRVRLISASEINIKVTYPADLTLARAWLQHVAHCSAGTGT